jgi:hypothetical protein
MFTLCCVECIAIAEEFGACMKLPLGDTAGASHMQFEKCPFHENSSCKREAT